MKQKLPITIPLFEDETLYSWLFRLYKANLYPKRKTLEEDFMQSQTTHTDGYGLTRPLFLATPFKDKQVALYNKHSLYPFFAPFSSTKKQERVLSIQRLGFEKGSPISSLRSEATEIRVCPECLQEDYTIYLHRSHQLPGVTVCHKHGCKLLVHAKHYAGEEMENLSPCFVPDYNTSDLERKFAIFQRDFMEASFDMDKEDLLNILKVRLKGLNLTNKEDAKNFLQERGVEVKDRLLGNLVRYPELLSQAFIQEHLFYFFEDIGVFKEYYKNLVTKEPDKKLMKKLKKEGYTLLSPYKKSIMEVRHEDCGHSFLITEHGLQVGLRCPECQNLSSQEHYQLLFDSHAQGEFELLSPFVNCLKKVRIKHQCGEVFESFPTDFYYQERGCPVCLSRLDLNAAQKKVDAVDPTYKVLNYRSLESHSTFLHTVCGHQIERRFSDFLRKKMSCPECKRLEAEARAPEYIAKVRELVGDEYEVVSTYRSDRQPIFITHKTCGLTQSYQRASYFLKGQRCNLCTHFVSDEEVKKYVESKSKGLYEITDFLPGGKVRIKNTKTDEVIELKKQIVMQELDRPTPSFLLPCEKKSDEKRPPSKSKRFFDYLKKHHANKVFELKDIGFEKTASYGLKKMLVRLTMLGLIQRVPDGGYLLKDKD